MLPTPKGVAASCSVNTDAADPEGRRSRYSMFTFIN
jgi:hypothetical protein